MVLFKFSNFYLIILFKIETNSISMRTTYLKLNTGSKIYSLYIYVDNYFK